MSFINIKLDWDTADHIVVSCLETHYQYCLEETSVDADSEYNLKLKESLKCVLEYFGKSIPNEQ
jgi:hypothetical protein